MLEALKTRSAGSATEPSGEHVGFGVRGARRDSGGPLASRSRGLVAAVLLAGSAASSSPFDVPWPHGAPPSGGELDEMVAGAIELAERERFEEFFEAFEKGEAREHVIVYQKDIDERVWTTEQLFVFGDALFEHEFTRLDGYGDGRVGLQRIHNGLRGGLDTFSCAACHFVGGPDGAGAETQAALLEGDGERLSSVNERNPPHALGLGFVQSLAAEMTSELHATRNRAVEEAKAQQKEVRLALSTKGVDFGEIAARNDGTVDTSRVRGVSPDLVVRPFGWKGSIARLRRFVEDAARIHFGVQAHTLTLAHKDAPDPARLGTGSDWWDPDADGVQRELEEGSLTAGAIYLALLEVPVILPPRDPELLERFSEGAEVFDRVGCSDCHRRELPLIGAYWEERSDTTDAEGFVINLLAEGESPRGSKLVKLFSDLKRHDMGDGLAEAHDDSSGVGRSEFLTRPLWGLAESAPYLHDGRAPTIPDAIVAHGGEASESRDAFLALSDRERQSLHVFLLSLTREPKPRVAR